MEKRFLCHSLNFLIFLSIQIKFFKHIVRINHFEHTDHYKEIITASLWFFFKFGRLKDIKNSIQKIILVTLRICFQNLTKKEKIRKFLRYLYLLVKSLRVKKKSDHHTILWSKVLAFRIYSWNCCTMIFNEVMNVQSKNDHFLFNLQ